MRLLTRAVTAGVFVLAGEEADKLVLRFFLDAESSGTPTFVEASGGSSQAAVEYDAPRPSSTGDADAGEDSGESVKCNVLDFEAYKRSPRLTLYDVDGDSLQDVVLCYPKQVGGDVLGCIG